MFIVENSNKLRMPFVIFGFLFFNSCGLSEEPLASLEIEVGYEEQRLSVAMSSNAGENGEQPRLIGHYIYVSNGENVKEDINSEGGNAWNFSGSHFKEVVIKNVKDFGSYQIFVSEGEATVYKTGLIEGKEPTIYRKNEL